MGNNSNNRANKKHIYDELNKSIDSFTSCDDYSHSDDDNKRKKQKRKTKNNYKLKYKLKKHKNYNNNELNIKLIESSLQVSNFLINNIINKDIGERPLPDANLLNSLIMYPNLFCNEGLNLKEQKEFGDKMIYDGLNKYKKEYKIYELNKKSQNTNFDYFNNYPVSTEKIYVNNINNTKEFNNEENNKNNNENNCTPVKYKKKTFDKIHSRNSKIINYIEQPKTIDYNKKYEKFLYKEKENKIYNIHKDYFTQNKIKNNDSINFNDNPFLEKNQKNIEEINHIKNGINNNSNEMNNKIYKKININKGKNVRKKIFINKNINNISTSKNYKNSFNNDDDSSLNNIKIKNNKKKSSEKIKYDININNNISGKDILSNKSRKTNVKINKNVKRKIKINNNDEIKNKRSNTFELNNSNIKNIKKIKINNEYKNKNEFSNSSNYIERNNSFNIVKNKPVRESNKIQKLSNFNIENNQKINLFNPNKNFEFKSEYKKSQIYLNGNNDEDKILNDLTKSSLKDFLNKETKIIKENASYIKSKKNGEYNKKEMNNIKSYRNKEKSKNERKSNNPFLNNSNDLKINFNDNISNISQNNNNDISVNSIKSKLNKFRNSNESNQKTVIKIDLRQALSKISNKNNY